MKLQTKQSTTQKNLTFGLTIIFTVLLGAVATQARATSILTTGLNNSPKIITAGQASLLATESGITAPDDIVSQSPRDGNSEIYAMNRLKSFAGKRSANISGVYEAITDANSNQTTGNITIGLQ